MPISPAGRWAVKQLELGPLQGQPAVQEKAWHPAGTNQDQKYGNLGSAIAMDISPVQGGLPLLQSFPWESYFTQQSVSITVPPSDAGRRLEAHSPSTQLPLGQVGAAASPVWPMTSNNLKGPRSLLRDQAELEANGSPTS